VPWARHTGCSLSFSVNRGLLLGVVVGVFLCGRGAEAARRGGSAAHSDLAQRAVWRAERWVGLPSLSKVSHEVNDDCSGFTSLA